MKNAEVLSCSYSYHTQPLQINELGGLSCYLFRLQTEGYCQALVQGEMRDIGPGDLLMYKAGDPYRLVIGHHPRNPENKVSSADYFLFCRGAWLDEWWQRRPRPTVVHLDPHDHVLAIWQMLIVEKRRLGRENEELSDYLLRALALQFDQAIAAGSGGKGQPFVAMRMRNFIEEHATVPFRLEDLARHVGLSVSRAVHLFKRCYGQTIIQYTNEVRLAIAEERMKYSSMTLEHIAETCGFGNYSYFYKVFRKKHGISPAEYRHRWEQKQVNGA